MLATYAIICCHPGKERKGKERKGKERKGKERKGKERRAVLSVCTLSILSSVCIKLTRGKKFFPLFLLIINWKQPE
jgi:hypothetical protein